MYVPCSCGYCQLTPARPPEGLHNSETKIQDALKAQNMSVHDKAANLAKAIAGSNCSALWQGGNLILMKIGQAKGTVIYLLVNNSA